MIFYRFHDLTSFDGKVVQGFSQPQSSFRFVFETQQRPII